MLHAHHIGLRVQEALVHRIKIVQCPGATLACVLDTLARGNSAAIAHDRHQQLAILKLGHIGHQGGIVHGHEGIAARGALPRQMVSS